MQIKIELLVAVIKELEPVLRAIGPAYTRTSADAAVSGRGDLAALQSHVLECSPDQGVTTISTAVTVTMTFAFAVAVTVVTISVAVTITVTMLVTVTVTITITVHSFSNSKFCLRNFYVLASTCCGVDEHAHSEISLETAIVPQKNTRVAIESWVGHNGDVRLVFGENDAIE